MRCAVLTSFQPGEGGEQADADVDRPVAHREHPAVPGQVVAVAVAQVEVALDPRLVVERAREVAADRHARAGTCGPARCRAPGRTGSSRRRRPRRSGPGTVSVDPALACAATIAPVTRPPSTIGATASVAGQSVAPAFTARSATISSRSRRRTTYPYDGKSGCSGQASSSVTPWAIDRRPSYRWYPRAGRRGPCRRAGGPPGASGRRRRSSRAGTASCSTTSTRWPALGEPVRRRRPRRPRPDDERRPTRRSGIASRPAVLTSVSTRLPQRPATRAGGSECAAMRYPAPQRATDGRSGAHDENARQLAW